jgi:hypothetical protein
LTVLTRDRARRPVPKAKRGQQTNQQNRRAAGVADTQRAIGEIRHRGAEGRVGDDRRPVEKGMKLLRHDLQADEDYQGSEEESGTGQIALVERHGDGIAAGFVFKRKKQPTAFR